MELASRQVLPSGATASDAAEQLHPLPGPPCTADGDGDGDNPTRAARGEVPTDAPPAPADIERAPSARAQPPRPEGMAFNAPQLHAGKCAHTLCVISLRLVLWVGIWDLVDYHIIPAATSALAAHNGTALGVCEHASNEVWQPGVGELYSHPGCALTKALLIVVGVLGLYVTRSLYGAKPHKEALFRRLP